MKHKLNKENWNKYIGKDNAVVFEKDGNNLKIIAKISVDRDYRGNVSSIPDIIINGETKSPTHLNPDFMREEYGWETFSVDDHYSEIIEEI